MSVIKNCYCFQHQAFTFALYSISEMTIWCSDVSCMLAVGVFHTLYRISFIFNNVVTWDEVTRIIWQFNNLFLEIFCGEYVCRRTFLWKFRIINIFFPGIFFFNVFCGGSYGFNGRWHLKYKKKIWPMSARFYIFSALMIAKCVHTYTFLAYI